MADFIQKKVNLLNNYFYECFSRTGTGNLITLGWLKLFQLNAIFFAKNKFLKIDSLVSYQQYPNTKVQFFTFYIVAT